MSVMIDLPSLYQATFEARGLSALWVQQIHGPEGKVASSMALGTAGTVKAEPLLLANNNYCLSINSRNLDLFKKNRQVSFTNCFDLFCNTR